MLRFIIRRLMQLVLVVFVLSLLLFLWLRALPGGIVSAMLGERATPETRARLTHELGLDEPIWVQYWTFLKRAVTGDFGVSNGVQPGKPALLTGQAEADGEADDAFSYVIMPVRFPGA